MAYIYRSKSGKTYWLRFHSDRKGNRQYFLSSKAAGHLAEQLPADYFVRDKGGAVTLIPGRSSKLTSRDTPLEQVAILADAESDQWTLMSEEAGNNDSGRALGDILGREIVQQLHSNVARPKKASKPRKKSRPKKKAQKQPWEEKAKATLREVLAEVQRDKNKSRPAQTRKQKKKPRETPTSASKQPEKSGGIWTTLAQFGFPAFRPFQEEAINHLLRGQNALVVQATGSGKSLIYQVAAHHRPGITIVISPLIALMQDQVDALERRGIRATFINSTLPQEDRKSVV